MDKKTLLAVGLSLLIWVVWEKTYLEPIQRQAALEHQRQEALKKQKLQAQSSDKVSDAGIQALKKPAVSAPLAVEPKNLQIENATSKLLVSNDSFLLKGWELESFSKAMDKQTEKLNLSEITGFSNQLKIRFSDNDLSKALDLSRGSLELKNNGASEWKVETAAVKAQRTFKLDESGYGAQVHYSFEFSGEAPKFIFLDLFGSPKRAADKEGSIFGQAPDKVKISFRDLNGRHSEMAAQHKENQESDADVKWLGLDTRYFVLALVPVRESGIEFGAQVAPEDLGVPAVRGSLVFPTKGKKAVQFSAKVYFGPKDMAALTRVDPVLSDAIDFGWTSFLAIPLLQALKWLHSYLKNYGIAIIVLTFLIKMILFPLMYKSMKSMAKMSKLQPQLNALREKYKDDKEKLNVEMMNFMKANGYNPVGGCLPILFQMPIFFALYRVLFNSMELYQAPFLGWIHDLSSPDPFFVTPVLLTGLMFLQQKLSPNTAADPAQQKMLQIMPVMFGAFMLMLPSGLTIYMVVNSAVSIAQQYFLNRKLGIVVGGKPAVAQ